MAAILQDYPELRTFVLEDVLLTRQKIGSGAYSCVEEGRILGALCAVKTFDNTFPQTEFQCVVDKFVEECRLMSTLRHPHIVQFLGIHCEPGSRLPALVMERMPTNLHALLETRPDIPLALKHSFLYDVAKGISYMHSRSPPLVHRNLSAKSVLLNFDLTAKIGGLGKARTVSSQRVATVTTAPDVSMYKPPEAMKGDYRHEKTIDIFSLGVVAIFTLTQQFPEKVLPQVYRDQQQRRTVVLTELERRRDYMQLIYHQLRKDHPLVQLIEQCLERFPLQRPNIQRVMQLLEQARTEIDDTECRMDRLELVRAAKKAVLEIESKDREIEALKQEMQAKEEHHREIVAKRDEIKHRMETAEQESTKLVDELMKKIQSQQIEIEQLTNPAMVSSSIYTSNMVSSSIYTPH